MPSPARGDIWLADFSPTRGHEQAGQRPALIVSADAFNRGLAGLVIAIPVTSVEKGIAFHVEANPPEGGLKRRSFIMCEAMRSISTDRLLDFWGRVAPATLSRVEDMLKVLLSL